VLHALCASVTCVVTHSGGVGWWITRESGQLAKCRRGRPSCGGQEEIEEAASGLSVQDRKKSYFTLVIGSVDREGPGRRCLAFARLDEKVIDAVAGVVGGAGARDGYVSLSRLRRIKQLGMRLDPRSRLPSYPGGEQELGEEGSELEEDMILLWRKMFVAGEPWSRAFCPPGVGGFFCGVTDSVRVVEQLQGRSAARWIECPVCGD
jgi:hypothetical protein